MVVSTGVFTFLVEDPVIVESMLTVCSPHVESKWAVNDCTKCDPGTMSCHFDHWVGSVVSSNGGGDRGLCCICGRRLSLVV